MAVYKSNYGRYRGELTAAWSRFLILPRYTFREVFKSRGFVAFFTLCFAAPFAGLLMIYLHHNLAALKFLNLPLEQLQQALPINASFFRWGLNVQGRLCFLMTLFVAPALVAPDLRNNGLALYLSRPFTRSEYVLGRFTVLAGLLSLITWIPALLLFFFQGYLDGAGWLAHNLSIGWAVLMGSWVWIAVLSLLGLAVSAWVKWKPVARISLLILFFVPWAFGGVINSTLDTWWGWLVGIWPSINTVWLSLFGLPIDDSNFLGNPMPVWAAWAVLTACCLVCLGLLSTRIRAYEVIR